MAGIGLVVADKAALTAGDTAIRDRIVGLGHTVTAISDEEAEHTGLAAYVITESSASANVTTKYRDSASPVFVLEHALWDDHGYAPGGGLALTVTNIHHTGNHPIVAGIADGAAFYTAATDTRARSDWSTGGVEIGAGVAGGADFFLWAAEKGATNGTVTWNSRRVGLGVLDPNVTKLAAAGWQVFDQAIGWLLGTVTTNILTPNQASADTALAWSAKGTNTTVSRDTAVFRSGPASTKLVATAAGTVEATTGWRAVKNVPDKVLPHSIWVRTSGTAAPGVKAIINWIDASGTLISPQVSISFTGTHAADAFVNYTAPKTTPPAGAVEAEIVLIFSNLAAAQGIYFDDYEILPEDKPVAAGFTVVSWIATGWRSGITKHIGKGAEVVASTLASNKFYLGGKRPSGPDANDGLIYNTPIGSNAVYTDAKLEPANASSSRITVDEIWLSYPDQPLGILRSTVFPKGDYTVRIPQDSLAVHDGSPNGIVAFLIPDNTAVWNGQSMLRNTPTSVAEVEYLYPQTVTTGIGANATDFRGQHGGSHLSGLFGCIREWEWEAILEDSNAIRHALAINVWAKKYLRGTPQGETKGNVWPAPSSDSYWDVSGHAGQYGAAPVAGGPGQHMKMGALLALPPSVSLAFVTDARVLAIAKALQTFGGYIVDDTFWDVHALSVEYTIASKFKNAGTTFHSELMKVFTELHVVANNTPTSIGGGGSFLTSPPPALTNG